MSDRDDMPSDDMPSDEMPSEAELLLPWYGTGRLSEAERAKVEAWLEAHPEARRQSEFVGEERETTVARNEAAPTPGAGAVDRLMARVAAEPRRRGGVAAGWLQKLDDWLAAMSPGMRGALGAAAVLLVIGQAAAIGVMIARQPATYEVATGEAAGPARGAVLVSFAPQARAAEIAGLLAELDARIVDGPRPGNLFALAIPEDADPEEVAALLSAREDLVSFAAPGNVQ